MKMKRVQTMMHVAVLGSAVLLPATLFAQMPDPNMNSQSPQNTNLPTGQPGNSTQTGASTNSTGSMRDSLGAPGDTGQQMADKVFLKKAAEGGIAEIQFGMLATQKGSPDVKVFAQKMVDDHTMMMTELKALGDADGVMMPKKMSKDDQAEYAKLQGLSGKDFDTEYILTISKAHRMDFRDYRMEASSAADPALATATAKDSMMIREHLMMIGKLAKDQGVELPARPPRPQAPPAGQ